MENEAKHEFSPLNETQIEALAMAAVVSALISVLSEEQRLLVRERSEAVVAHTRSLLASNPMRSGQAEIREAAFNHMREVISGCFRQAEQHASRRPQPSPQQSDRDLAS